MVSFNILVLFTTYGVAKECIKVLMEATPNGNFIVFIKSIFK